MSSSSIRAVGTAAAAWGVAAALVLAGQAPSTPQPTFRAGVDVVQVDVSVLDKDRKPVRGLTAADFTILEDGKPRPIVAFIPVDLAERAAVPPAAAWVREVPRDVTANDLKPEGRLVVIMFDWSIRFSDQMLARRVAAAAVDALGPDDLAAVVFSSAFANGGTPQNFTADRARLLAAIDRPFAVAMQNPPRGSPGHDPRNNNDLMIDDPEGYESGDCYCRLCVPEAIARVADAVRDVRGRRKSLLFIGTYVRLYEGLQGPSSRQGPAFKPGLAGRPVVYPGTCSARLKDARDKMARATSLANLTIHAVDPVGLETAGNSPLGGELIAMLDRRDDLASLADTTGGRTVMNTNAPDALVPEVFAESQSYYLLAFAPADLNAKDKFHEIDVKVNRPGVSVRTRAGYYTEGTGARAAVSSRMSPDAAALEGVLPATDVPLRVTVAPFAMPGKTESAVAIVVGVESKTGADDVGPGGPVKVLAAAFERHGRSVQSQEQTVSVTRGPGADGANYELLSRLALKPGRYEVRVALDAGPGQRASVYTDVEVPDFAKQPLSLSGIVLSASPAVGSAPADAFSNVMPVVPTVRREFARSTTASAFVRVYQGTRDAVQPASLTARIVDTSDRSVLHDRVAFTADHFGVNRSADYQIALPIDRLEPGEYLLMIEATQGRHRAGRVLRFRVR
jgi:VWFA-related protein